MADGVRVQRLGPDDWALWRDVRLASLADAPYAYGSTLAREQEFDEATWRGRLTEDHRGVTAVAVSGLSGVDGVGAIAVYTPPETGEPMLVAAWVAPTVRGRGVGDALVAEMLDWARAHNHPQLELRVADGNAPARNLFLRNGFVPTGEREPLESDPTIGTERLVHKLS